jgi:HK97 family phage prohead protease
MNNILLKDEYNNWFNTTMKTSDLNQWFKSHVNDKGVVQEDIIIFKEVKPTIKDEKIQFVLSDMTLDRSYERIDPKGWILDSYQKNPLILWQHDGSRPAIGKMENVEVVDGQLIGEAVFDSEGKDEFAAMIEDKIRKGFLSTGSVGFQPKLMEIQDDDEETRLIHREQELFEFSIVNVPANINARVVKEPLNKESLNKESLNKESLNKEFDSFFKEKDFFLDQEDILVQKSWNRLFRPDSLE